MWKKNISLRRLKTAEIEGLHKAVDGYLLNDPVVRDVHRFYQLLDGKSAALFSHVSIMIAACTFLAGSLETIYSREILLFLVVLYLCIATVLLRILNFNMYDLPDKKSDTENVRSHFVTAAKKRAITHRDALLATSLLTIITILLILYDTFGKSILNWFS